MTAAATEVPLAGERSRLALAAMMLTIGVTHFVVPKFFDPLIPEPLGNPRAWVYGSGVAEIVAGVLTAVPRTKRVGALLAMVVIVLVYPGNIKMALDAGRPDDAASWAAWIRLPLQFPMIWWAWRVAERAKAS